MKDLVILHQNIQLASVLYFNQIENDIILNKCTDS